MQPNLRVVDVHRDCDLHIPTNISLLKKKKKKRDSELLRETVKCRYFLSRCKMIKEEKKRKKKPGKSKQMESKATQIDPRPSYFSPWKAKRNTAPT